MSDVARRLGRRVLRSGSPLTESASLRRTATGRRDATHGEWIPGTPPDPVPVTCATWPITGKERETLPEGLRTSDGRTFYLYETVTPTIEGERDGDVLRYGGIDYRAVRVKDWAGFFEVQAIAE